MLDYLWKAASAWLTGFFPLAEIYVAVPAAVALGLDDVSVIVWTVFGNFTPALLIDAFAQRLKRIPPVARWLARLTSETVEARVNRWGTWFVLLVTPMTGIWIMAVTANALGMARMRFLVPAFFSILLYALVILGTLRAGLDVFG